MHFHLLTRLPAPEPEGRNSLARVRKPRVDGRKPVSPVGAALQFRKGPPEYVFRSTEGRRAARSGSVENFGRSVARAQPIRSG